MRVAAFAVSAIPPYCAQCRALRAKQNVNAVFQYGGSRAVCSVCRIARMLGHVAGETIQEYFRYQHEYSQTVLFVCIEIASGG